MASSMLPDYWLQRPTVNFDKGAQNSFDELLATALSTAGQTGTVYLLPRETFIVQPPLQFGPYEVHFAQLASFVPLQPLAKLTVGPADFPFLIQIRGHDDQRLQEYANALQTGAPWPKYL